MGGHIRGNRGEDLIGGTRLGPFVNEGPHAPSIGIGGNPLPLMAFTKA